MFRVIVLATVSFRSQDLKETSESTTLLAFHPPGQTFRPRVWQYRHFKVTHSAYCRDGCIMFHT